MTNLLPCPFCGGNLFVNGLRIARCDHDDCFMRAKMTVDLDDPEQIDAWNTRADLPRPQDAARIAELEAENARLREALETAAADCVGRVPLSADGKTVIIVVDAWMKLCAALAADSGAVHD